MLEAVKPVLLEKVDIISWQFTNSGRGIYIRRLPCRPYPYHHQYGVVVHFHWLLRFKIVNIVSTRPRVSKLEFFVALALVALAQTGKGT
jgi:hypothetical protein